MSLEKTVKEKLDAAVNEMIIESEYDVIHHAGNPHHEGKIDGRNQVILILNKYLGTNYQCYDRVKGL